MSKFGVVALAGLVISSALAGGSTASRTSELKVSVTYQQRGCTPAGHKKPRATSAAVTAGRLELRRNGAPVDVTIEEDGTSPSIVRVPGEGPIEGTLVLETGHVRILEGATGTRLETIDLGRATPHNGRLSFSVGDTSVGDESGHVNILIWLERAARNASLASPSVLPAVYVRTRSQVTTHFHRPSTIKVEYEEEWEPWTLAHEYGHFLEYKLDALGGDGGDHSLRTSYPERPTLSWNEGFATAFAATVPGVARHGVIPYRCDAGTIDLTRTPATPALNSKSDVRYAQYSELRVGAATYQLMQRLGGPDTGLTRLLHALPGYHRSGHSVWTARDLRDLAAEQFETGPADHAAIDRIFAAQGIVWWQGFTVGLNAASRGALSQAQSAGFEVVVSLTGPGGFDCRTTAKDLDVTPTHIDAGIALGKKVADGGLSRSANDDCYLVSGDGKVGPPEEPHSLGGDSVTVPFPFLDGAAHWNEFQVHAKFVCDYDERYGPRDQFKCPRSLPVSVYVQNLTFKLFSPPAAYAVTLATGADKTIATFKGDGKCEVLADGKAVDCSV